VENDVVVHKISSCFSEVGFFEVKKADAGLPYALLAACPIYSIDKKIFSDCLLMAKKMRPPRGARAGGKV